MSGHEATFGLCRRSGNPSQLLCAPRQAAWLVAEDALDSDDAIPCHIGVPNDAAEHLVSP